jgi:hypothetical protein
MRGGLVAGLLIVSVVALTLAVVPGYSSARRPGNCYCDNVVPPYPSSCYTVIDSVQNPTQSGVGANGFFTAPWTSSTTGQVGVDQYSTATGAFVPATYARITTLGWTGFCAEWVPDFQPGTAHVSLFWDWSANWAYSDGSSVDGAYYVFGQISTSLNVLDLTTGKYVFSTAPSYTIISHESSNNDVLSSNGLGTYWATDTVSQSLFPSGHEFEFVSVITLETKAYLAALTVGVAELFLNMGDGGDYAVLTDMGYSSVP